MYLRLRLPRHSAYDDTFFWSGECQYNEVQLYFVFFIVKLKILEKSLIFLFRFQVAVIKFATNKAENVSNRENAIKFENKKIK